jgi:hypothetical protein
VGDANNQTSFQQGETGTVDKDASSFDDSSSGQEGERDKSRTESCTEDSTTQEPAEQ